MTDETRTKAPRRRITLDSQLMSYWEREAKRLDALAANAKWRWVSRRYARKAARARAQGARSTLREAARGTPSA
ncbi:hypothetical protein G3T14_07480 [Methylobacterium sp. BTF04]|uniref:hypothetical protein n=1 Tax=Methylobacterium sp. BTF04 TaxID=2708300 RepID=UPI0013D341B0|nr:hypothetical protein [Methylobacterium sp. BTF04]NEU11969.1 hypothetical protein [Methylobacterium sp. BTF04]